MNIRFKCANCGDILWPRSVKQDDEYPDDTDVIANVEVHPCGQCISRARNAGLADGKHSK